MSADILVLVALLAEERLLGQLIQSPTENVLAGKRFIEGRLGGQRVVAASTGMGKVNAACISTLALQHYHPRVVIGSGIAGAMNPQLLPGDVLIAERVAQHDFGDAAEDDLTLWRTKNPVDFEANPLFFPASEKLLLAAEHTMGGNSLEGHPELSDIRPPKIIRGALVTGDAFISSRGMRRRLWERYQAQACDMESGAVAQVCLTFDTPFLAMRGISDTQQAALDQIEQYADLAMTNALQVIQSTIAHIELDECPL